MRIHVPFALLALAAAASADPIDEARERLRNGSVDEAKAAIEVLVGADTADAVKALQQGAEAVLGRLRKEQGALDRKSEERNRVLSKLIDLSAKSVEMIAAGKHRSAEWNALEKDIDAAKDKDKKLAEEQSAARAKVTASDSIVLAALPSFGRFRSDGAVGVIERIASAKSGRMSRACTGALVRIGAARSLPVLADLSRAGDPMQRAMAARGLKAVEGTPPALLACLADKAWQVRYAAYDAATLGPLPVAIPMLIDARAAAPKEDLLRIDLCLGRLTGLAFPESSQWKGWWGENGDAVRNGTFRTAGDGPPAPPEDPCLAAVLASRRLALVLGCDFRVPVERDEDAGHPKPNLFEPTRKELKRAIAAIPDGATFGIATGFDSMTPVRASDASRRAAAEWVDKLRGPVPEALSRVLTRLLITDPSEDADTVLLVSASGRNAEPGVVDLLVAQLGELTAGPAVHCVGTGDSCDEYLLASVALQTGGAFVDSETRLRAKIPAPGADRWTAGNVRVAAFRAFRSREREREALVALASIGEEAYPLLEMIIGRLGSSESDDVRVEALGALGAMGPWAREAVPLIQTLAGDSSPVLSKAAQAALDRISPK